MCHPVFSLPLLFRTLVSFKSKNHRLRYPSLYFICTLDYFFVQVYNFSRCIIRFGPFSCSSLPPPPPVKVNLPVFFDTTSSQKLCPPILEYI